MVIGSCKEGLLCNSAQIFFFKSNMRNLAGFSAIIALLFVIKCFHYLCVELILNVIYVLLVDLK